MTLLTLDNTAIVADSTCDPPDGYFERDNLRLVPLKVHFGDETYRDAVDLSSDAFFARLAASQVMPTTSQPTVAEFDACFSELKQDYAHVFSLHLSRLMSGTYEAASAAAREHEGVEVFDTTRVSTVVTLLIDRLLVRLERGVELDELRAYIASFPARSGLVFQVATLEYLRRGGRIGRAQSMVGDILGIRPLLHVADGEVTAYAKVRGERKGLQAMTGYLEQHTRPHDTIFGCLFHAAAPEALEPLRESLLASRPQIEFSLTSKVGAVVGTHAGPGTFAYGLIVE
jgi:DegV family protein with EDD domain